MILLYGWVGQSTPLWNWLFDFFVGFIIFHLKNIVTHVLEILKKHENRGVS